jgi:hypothetical protein
MFTRVCLSLALLVAMPAWPQVGTDETEPGQVQMLIPPPVNGEAYPSTVGSETRSNYLSAGLAFNTAYTDNVLAAVGFAPASDVTYSIWPTIAIDQTTSRLHWRLSYSPGFTMYQRASSLNKSDQKMVLGFRYRLTPHVTVHLWDSLQKTSNVLNQPDLFSGGSISGTAQPPPIAVIVPAANQLINTSNAVLTYQFSRNGMIGGEGISTTLHYFDPAEVPGLYDSSWRGGSAFFSQRLSRKQYVGTAYQYLQIVAYPVNAQNETLMHTVLFFYTVYLKPTFSFSLSVGPQHFDIVQSPLPVHSALSPAATASIGWQGTHTSFAARYLRFVSGGGGLVGAFNLNSADASTRWQFARTWEVKSRAAYSINGNATPSFFLSTPGGHSFSGTVSVQHSFTEHLMAELGYIRLHQSYNGIPLIANAPNTNLQFISVSYQFARPLGR